MEKYKKIKLGGEMYGILISLKDEYDTIKTDIDFELWAVNEVNKLFKVGLEWMADDEKDLIGNL